jgi:hypothetical protein
MDIGGYDPAWPVSDENIAENDIYQVYPNPAMEFLYVQSGSISGSDFSAELIDPSGRIVYSKKYQSAGAVRISLHKDWKGLYLLRLMDESGPFVKKLVIR